MKNLPRQPITLLTPTLIEEHLLPKAVAYLTPQGMILTLRGFYPLYGVIVLYIEAIILPTPPLPLGND